MILVDYNFPEIRRELALHDFQLLYLQSEQKQRREELDELQRKQDALLRKWEEVKRDYQRVCDSMDRVTCPDFIKQIKDPERKKKFKKLARDWKKRREFFLLKQA